MTTQNYENYKIPPSHWFALKDLLMNVGKVLNNYKIQWWMDGGSLLSIGRNQKCAHDDDEDIGIMYRDRHKALKAIKHLEKLGYHMCDYPSMIKVFIPNMWMVSNTNNQVIGTPTLDIFYYTQKGNYIVLHDISQRIKYSKAKHKKDDLFKLKKIQYYDFEVFVPNNYLPYLNGLYPNWQNEIWVQKRSPPTEEKINIKEGFIVFEAKSKRYLRTV